ncbi:MAG: FlgD immunoglobulin-like domain containing protein, partial [Gemmatimonadota bacterium]|nr:FlgD immunoglobulin-like domain containing protein [Gemmatimonadota bacterium]
YNAQFGRASLPRSFSLSQNAPNPFNPSTTIGYCIPQGETVDVSLKIYNIRGGLVRTLVNATREPGAYEVYWDGTDKKGRRMSSGIYIYRIEAGSFVQTRKMVLLK